jgi:NADH-quinone oxidoreductase subunit M
MTGSLLAAFTITSTVTVTNAGPTDVLLPLLIAIPLLGALAVALFRDVTITRTIAVGFSIATLVLAALLLVKLPGVASPTDGDQIRFWDFASSNVAFGGMRFALSADAISGWLVALTAVLTPCAMMATKPHLERSASFFAWLLVLEATIIGAFLSSDLLLFYIFFELTLVPSFLLIGQWGGADKRAAATKFFIYTFTGSLFMLASILYVGLHAHSFDIATCGRYAQTMFTSAERTWVLLGLLAGLAVKVPLLPFHTWLPITYTQSSSPVTAIVAGALGKLGTYGILRIAIPLGVLPVLPGHSQVLSWMIALSVLAIIYAALIAWVQRDYKTLVAYSSISHLGFCVLALCCLNTMGGQAGVLYMVNHGISTAALFLMLGFVEQRAGTRVIENVSGLGRDRPKLAFFFVLFVMSSIGLPLTNGFVSEFLAILSTVSAQPRVPFLVTVMAASGVVLGAVYMLHLTAKLIFGPSKQPVEATGHIPDLNGREVLSVLPLALLVIVLGVRPNFVFDSIKGPVALLMSGSNAVAESDVRATLASPTAAEQLRAMQASSSQEASVAVQPLR